MSTFNIDATPEQLRETAELLHSLASERASDKLGESTWFDKTGYHLTKIADIMEEEAKPKPLEVYTRELRDGLVVYIDLPGQDKTLGVYVCSAYNKGWDTNTLDGPSHEWGNVKLV